MNTTSTLTYTEALNMALAAIQSHEYSHLVQILVSQEENVQPGTYPKIYPVALIGNERWNLLSIRGHNSRILINDLCKISQAEITEKIHEILNDINNPRQWEQKIEEGTKPILDPFYSTDSSDEVRFKSSEKEKLDQYRDKRGDLTLSLNSTFKINARFWVTSYHASILQLVDFCPEATTDKPNWIGSHPQIPNLGQYATIGEFGFSENGSGFNKKYQHFIESVDRICRGDWEQVTPLYQHNRTTSYDFKEGAKVRFWSAQLTFPEKSYQLIQFPLPNPLKP